MFGGSKKSASKGSKGKGPAKSVVISTGGKIDEMVMALCHHAPDSSVKVRKAISEALTDLARQQPDLVVSSIMQYLRKHSSCAVPHRILLLQLTKKILDFARDKISEQLVDVTLETCMRDMVSTHEVKAEWQGTASKLIVNIGMRCPDKVVDILIARFRPGKIPHYFVVKTLGDLAITNAVPVVPRLKTILSRLVPVLGQVKPSNMKWVISSSLYKFCDAISTFEANVVDNPDDLSRASFSGEIFPAFEILFNNWLGSREAKVRTQTIQAIGNMCAILTKSQFDSQLPRILEKIQQLFKKHSSEPFPITQGLSVILEVAVKDDDRVLDVHLNSLLVILHGMALRPVDENNANSVRNHNELLRCFEIIGRVFIEEEITFLLGRLDINTFGKRAVDRDGTLRIIRHLITYLNRVMDGRRGLLVSGIAPLLREEKSSLVRKGLLQMIIAMAPHDYLSVEGGEVLVEFVVRHSSVTDEDVAAEKKQREGKKSKEPWVSQEELRNMAENVLNLSTTTIPCMRPVLWPYLLEVVLPPQYTAALAMVTKCLAYIGAERRREASEDYMINFDRQLNLPQPHEIVGRLLVVLCSPLRRGQLGLHILGALHALGPVLHPQIGDLWDSAIPRLATFLQNYSSEESSWDQSQWEDWVVRLLSETIKVVDDERWTIKLGDSLASQLPGYASDPVLKKNCFKHLGLVLQKCTKKEFIRSRLEDMFSRVQHRVEEEREGCAQGLGYAAASHLDTVLDKVNHAAEGPVPASSGASGGGGLFGFFSSKKASGGSGAGGGAKGDMLNTIMLCYGYIAAYSAPALITTRLSVHIVAHIKRHMAGAKSPALQDAILKALDLIGKAAHPDHLGMEWTLVERDELVQLLLPYINLKTSKKAEKKAEKGRDTVPPERRVLGLQTMTTLLQLQPAVAAELQPSIMNEVMRFYRLKPRAEDGEAGRKAVELINVHVNEVLCAVLTCTPTVACIAKLVETADPYTRSNDPVQRERACHSVLTLLKKYIELLTDADTPIVETAGKYDRMGDCLGLLIPRATDPVAAIRQSAVEAIGMLLFIDYMLHQGNPEDGYAVAPPQVLRSLSALREQAKSPETNVQWKVALDLSGVLSELLSDEELLRFLRLLMKGLTDGQASSTSGTAIVLNGMVKQRGAELADRVPEVVGTLLEEMTRIRHEQTMNATLHSVCNLAAHHRIPVINQLLASPLPHSQPVIKSLQVLARDEELVMDLVDFLTDTMSNSVLTEGKGESTRPTHNPMAATCALGEIMELEEMGQVVEEHYAQVAGTLLLRFGTVHGMKKASEQTIEAFRKFIACTKDDALSETMEWKGRWSDLGSKNYLEVIDAITRAIGESHRSHMKSLYEFLCPFLQGTYLGHRVVVSTVMAEMVNHVSGDSILLQQLVNSFLMSLSDDTIKMQSLRGLGNIVSNGQEEVDKYAPSVLDALVSSLDDTRQEMAMEAMNGLSKVFEHVDESRVAPTLINLCHKIRPAFELQNDRIRAASFNLFGTLSRFGDYPSAVDPFFEQIQFNLPALVLHVNDRNADAAEACKRALKRFAPLMRADDIEEYVNGKAFGPKFNYDSFLDQFARLLINNYPDRVNYYVMTSINYFKSPWTSMRASAATLVGFLLAHLPPTKRRSLNVGLISQALIQLLRQKDAEVRKRTAEAMGLLHDY